MTDDAFVEVIVTLKPGAHADTVSQWMERHGLQVTKMRAGFLVTAAPSAFERALGGAFPELGDRTRGDVSFPIPVELAASVSSIVARRLPSYPRPR